MTRLLAIETSAETGSVALLVGDEVVQTTHLGQPRDHGAHLAGAVAELLERAGRAVDAFAFSAGPGSFTGLRIGLAFVKGLAFARPAPVVSVCSLRARAASLARRRHSRAPILVVLDARRAGVFAGLFEPTWPHAARPELPVCAYSTADLRKHDVFRERVVAGGDGLSVVGPMPPSWETVLREEIEPEAGAVGRLGLRLFRDGGGEPAERVEPAYLVRSSPEETQAAKSYAKGSAV